MRKRRRGGPGRGLHGRADGPPGRLRERRRQPGHGADAGPGGGDRPLRPRIVLAYDVDPAGQHAGSIGGAELFQLIGALAAEETGVEITRVRVARLPEGKDPDEVIRETPDLWREAIRTAQPIIEFLIDYYATAFDVRTAEGKRHAVAALIPLLREIRDPVVRDGYLQTLARRTGVEERVLLEALHAPEPAGSAAAGRPGRTTAPAAAASPPTPSFRPRTRSTRRPS